MPVPIPNLTASSSAVARGQSSNSSGINYVKNEINPYVLIGIGLAIVGAIYFSRK